MVLLRITGSALIHASLPVLGDRRELGSAGKSRGCRSGVFLGALLKAQLKDFALRHAAGEVFDADATHGADFGNGAVAEA